MFIEFSIVSRAREYDFIAFTQAGGFNTLGEQFSAYAHIAILIVGDEVFHLADEGFGAVTPTIIPIEYRHADDFAVVHIDGQKRTLLGVSG